MSSAMYAVEGMMCESCMAAVAENVHSLSSVTVVAMALVAVGQSPLIVPSGTKLWADTVRDPLEHIVFGVLRPKDPWVGPLANSPAEAGGDHSPRRAGTSQTSAV